MFDISFCEKQYHFSATQLLDQEIQVFWAVTPLGE
jgi:hypothetical protein